jgi:hypothetical protein
VEVNGQGYESPGVGPAIEGEEASDSKDEDEN